MINFRKSIKGICFIFILVLILAKGIHADIPEINYWYEESVICRAMGSIAGNELTNSLESFIYNYDEVGMRLYEIDLVDTADKKLVLSSHAATETIPVDTFMSTPILGKYTPLSFQKLIEIMDIYSDSFFIIDPHMDKDECYSQMIDLLGADTGDFINRFIIQVYSREELNNIKENYSFNNYIYVIDSNQNMDLLSFAKLCFELNRKDVRAIQINESQWQHNYRFVSKLFGISVYSELTNDISKVCKYNDMYFDGFYTDCINNSKWYQDKLIAHALGGIDGDKSTNSKEAFIHSYRDLGMRVFEVDFMKSSDGELLLTHEFDEERQLGINDFGVPTEKYFKSIPVWGKYTPMDIDDLFELMDEYPGCYIMTDVKDDSNESVLSSLQDIVDIAKATGRDDMLDAFIIQFYHEDQLREIKNIYPFKNYVYTLYRTDFDETEKMFLHNVKFCKKNGVDVLTVRKAWWHKEFAKIKDRYGVKVFLHTINDYSQAEQYFDEGVDGLYTDFLTHKNIAEMAK